jgi:Tol biopolymer transport system component/DNA-binding winged helix-turn-helix (wHTH) protein
MAAPTQSSPVIRFGAFELDSAKGELRKAGVPLKIHPQPMRVLLLLLKHPGQVVTREEIQSCLWADNTFVDFDRGINFCVNQIRAVLGDSAEKPRYVETLPRRGYRFVASVVAQGDCLARTARGAKQPEPVCEPKHHSETGSLAPILEAPSGKARFTVFSRRRRIAAAIIMVVLIAAGAYTLHRQTTQARALNLEGLRFVKLTASGKAEDSAISPDGSYIVYSQRDRDGVGLWLHHIASGSETQILPSEDVDFRGLTFAPNSNSVYFVRSRKEVGGFKDLYAMPVLGGHAQLVSKAVDSAVSFSPDGHQFAYTEGFGPPYGNNIRVANSDGSENHVLVTLTGTSPNFHAGVAWSPDGRTIVISVMLRGTRSGYALDTVSPTDGTVREIFWQPGVIGRPLWMPDSKTMLVELDDSTGQGQLWAVSSRGVKDRRITNDLANWGIRIDATRDVQTISAIQWSIVAKLWSAPVTDLSNLRQITNGEMPIVAGVVRADGKILAVSGNDELWIMNGDGTGLAPFSTLHEVAPPVVCGNSVVVASYSTTSTATLPASPNILRGTKLASGRLVVHRSYQFGPADIMRVDADGLNSTRLAGGFLYSPACSPDRKFVFYVLMGARQKILRVPIQGGDSEFVGDVPGQTIRGTIRVSPDGRFLAFPYDQEQPIALSKLAVVSAETGQIVKTFETPGGVYRESCLRWSPDGRSLQYLLTTGDVTNIWDQALTGGQPHALTNFTTGRIFDFNWSADGKELLLARGEVTSDVILLSNVR